MALIYFAPSTRNAVEPKYGFKNLWTEWWHYTLINEPYKAAIRDIRGGYGKKGFLENIFRREKIVSAEENRVC